MKSFWKEKKILITGGTSGLGRALAIEARNRGAKVAVVARHILEASQQEGVVGIEADISRKEDIHRIAAEALARLGGVDLLINGASSLGPTPLKILLDTDCEDFETVLQTNLLGPFRLTKAILPAMLLQGRGTVVNISSDAAVSAYPSWGIYSASKAALDHLTRIWGAELSDQGLHFFSVDPGDMDTPMHAAAIPDADRTKLKSPFTAAAQLLEWIEKTENSEEGSGKVYLREALP